MLNKKLLKIDQENAFSTASAYVKEYKQAHPEKDVISLGIGDVSKPIVAPVIAAMHKAVDDLADMKTFSGYGNYYGIDELRQAIVDNDYRGLGISKEEVYVSDGTKTDSTNLLELFDINDKILLGNPTYPIYRNGAFALGREVYYTDCDSNYKMIVPNEHYDIIYICSPSNPIGIAYTYDDLQKWIDYALKEKAVIIYDNVYSCFITSEDVPKSIYEISGSKNCCIELNSFSKRASFTGLRCSYFVLPKEIDDKLFKERTINRFNGASYVAQKGAVATYLPESKILLEANLKAYKDNIKYLKDSFIKMGFEVVGGDDSPYIWVKIKENIKSFDYFKLLLNEISVVVVPGAIFGQSGDDHFRVSGLGSIENSKEAVKRIMKYYEKKN